MKKDEHYDIIKEDSTILTIGREIFETRKPNKIRQTKIKSISAMRRLAKLTALTDGVDCGADLFKIENITNIHETINEITDTSSSQVGKPGLKVALGNLIKLSSKILIPHYRLTNQPERVATTREFLEVFAAPTFFLKMFGIVSYHLLEKRQRENRKPSKLPDKKHIKILSDYMKTEINKITKKQEVNKSDYISLRKLTLAWVTLLNARRSSEAAALTVQDWTTRDSWLDGTKEQELIKSYSITFDMGKGTRLVPIFSPKQCDKALEVLCDQETRRCAGVAIDNNYIFAFTQDSQENSIGYNDIADVCKLANIPTITATSLRHLAATTVTSLEGLSEGQVKDFLEHIGHAKQIDEHVYACPPAARIMKNVIPILEQINSQTRKHSMPALSGNQMDTWTLQMKTRKHSIPALSGNQMDTWTVQMKYTHPTNGQRQKLLLSILFFMHGLQVMLQERKEIYQVKLSSCSLLKKRKTSSPILMQQRGTR